MQRFLIAVLCILALGLGVWLPPANSGPAPHPETAKAIARGKILFNKSWAPRAKSCKACHAAGPNKLSAARLHAYPKYDRFLRRVVSAQQKINYMIKKQSKGQPLPLGSEDLNALEAYLGTLGRR